MPLFFMSCLENIVAVHVVCDLNMKMSLMLSDGLFDLKKVHAFQCFSYLLLTLKYDSNNCHILAVTLRLSDT